MIIKPKPYDLLIASSTSLPHVGDPYLRAAHRAPSGRWYPVAWEWQRTVAIGFPSWDIPALMHWGD